jgi:hypothetical protein
MSDRYLGAAVLKSEGILAMHGGEPMPDGTPASIPTWRDYLFKAINNAGEDPDSAIVATTLSDRYIDANVDGYNRASEQQWIVWTMARVYFPIIFDGYVEIGSVPRDPCLEQVSFGNAGGY